MAFVNASLLVGGLLIAIPIVLHLAMRQQPKSLVFPALRFVQNRKVSNQRKLQWRQWLLLLLRCLLIGLLALAFARPSAASDSAGSWTIAGVLGLLLCFVAPAAIIAWRQGQASLTTWTLTGSAIVIALLTAFFAFAAVRNQPPAMLGDEEAPVAAALVFDTSPRMQYRLDNQTRIEKAQETAAWLIRQLPRESRLAVLDSQLSSPVFSVDHASAGKSIDRLESAPAPKPLAQLVTDSLRLLETSDLERKELYLFTDMTQAAWRGAQDEIEIAGASDVSIYVVDVGVKNPVNVSLGAIRLNSQVIARNSPLELEVEVRSQGGAASRQIELLVEQQDLSLPVVVDGAIKTPREEQRGRREVALDADAATTIRFRLEESQGGLRQGRIRLLGEDGLAIDDERYFAFRVDDAWPVLIVAPDNAWTVFFSQAVSPDDEKEQGRNRYAINEIRQTEIDRERYEDYAAVVLLDPKPLNDSQWTRLYDYLDQGGAMGIFLGRNAYPPESFNTKAAQRVLPGPLTTQWRAAGRELFLRIDRYQHPITELFEATSTSTPWQRFPVEKHWLIDPINPDSLPVVRFSNGKPCLLDRRVGRGRLVVMTTPLSEPASGPQRRTPWNELASGLDNWPPFLLANTTLQFLAASGDAELNYETGQTAMLPNSPAMDPQRYQMFLPAGQPFEVRARENRLVMPLTDSPGAYRLKGNRGGPVVRGFAVNWPASASDLQRMDVEGLTEIFGENGYRFASRRDEIERVQGAARVGREFYPLLMFVLTLVLALEHLIGKRFYPPPRTEAAPGSRAQSTASSG